VIAGLLAIAASIGTAYARAIVDQAIMPTMGCDAAIDLFEMRRENFTNLGYNTKIATAKVAAGKCFRISSGQQAYGAPEWQDYNVWRGVAVSSTKSGRRFYSDTISWHYVGEINNMLP
jgi:hypothetical protein